jgi:hypothetical protein
VKYFLAKIDLKSGELLFCFCPILAEVLLCSSNLFLLFFYVFDWDLIIEIGSKFFYRILVQLNPEADLFNASVLNFHTAFRNAV